MGTWSAVAALTLSITAVAPPRGAGAITPLLAWLGLVALPWVGRQWWYWAALTATTAAALLTQPLLDIDNHHFLHLYWLLAITLACLTRSPETSLATSARFLIGLVFLFATMWKLLTPDFTDGSFLAFSLSHHHNLARPAIALGWQDQGLPQRNDQAMDTLRHDPVASVDPLQIEVSAQVARIARPLSALTIVLEAGVALAFLLPLRGAWTRWRELVLFAFVLATYPAAAVLSFAALLLVMSLACTQRPPARAASLHVGIFIIVWGADQVLQAMAT